MTAARAILIASVALASLLAAGGCSPGTDPAAAAAASRQSAVATADVDLPPKELVERVKRVVSSPPVSLGVESHEKGTVVTGWKRHRGDWHIGRHWQERTRYRIDVAPDWDEPMARSRLTVTAETEQRAAEGQRWDREARVQRPERARGVLRVILEQVGRAGITNDEPRKTNQ